MKALILKLLTEGLSPADVAEKLRELADTIEAGELGDTDLREDGKLIGTVRLAGRKPALQALGTKPAPRAPKPPGCNLVRAIAHANALEAELRKGADGAAGLVLFDLIEPAAKVRQRLELLREVTQPKPINPS